MENFTSLGAVGVAQAGVDEGLSQSGGGRFSVDFGHDMKSQIQCAGFPQDDQSPSLTAQTDPSGPVCSLDR